MLPLPVSFRCFLLLSAFCFLFGFGLSYCVLHARALPGGSLSTSGIHAKATVEMPVPTSVVLIHLIDATLAPLPRVTLNWGPGCLFHNDTTFGSVSGDRTRITRRACECGWAVTFTFAPSALPATRTQGGSGKRQVVTSVVLTSLIDATVKPLSHR
jgi:hypothetical protein